MKKKLFICFLLIGSLMGNVMAQDIITNPLLFVLSSTYKCNFLGADNKQ